MRTRKHQQSIEILNLDKCILGGGDFQLHKKHGKLLPNTIRALICGPSNCGKSNVMLSLLFSPNGLKFENVYVYSKSLYQPKYQYLEEVLRPIKGVKYFAFKENDEILCPSKANNNSIFIFDDVACDKQEKIREYFSMGRHSGVDSFYLCQTYSRIPKQLIRDNANFIILYKQDNLNLKHVYTDHVSSDMNFEKFKFLCIECWRDKYGFLVIDKDEDVNTGRYRKYFDNLFINF